MDEVIDFAVVYPPADKAVAEALCEQLTGLGLNGSLYPSENDVKTLNSVAAKFFVVSNNDWGTIYEEAFQSVKKDAAFFPVWLNPGKQDLIKLDKYNSISGCGGITGQDLNRVKSEDFKNLLRRSNIKNSVIEEKTKKQEEIQGRNERQRAEVGSRVKGIPGGFRIKTETTRVSDWLDREKYAEKIATVMITEKTFETPSTIGVFAPWGSGKSHFINLIKEQCAKSSRQKLYIDDKNVKCCCFRRCCSCCCSVCSCGFRWWLKLGLWTCITFLVTIALVVAIAFVPYVVTQEKSRSETNTTTTAMPSSSSSMGFKEVYVPVLVSAAGVIIVAVLCTLCCQKKVYDDCCAAVKNWGAECCLASKAFCYLAFFSPPKRLAKTVPVSSSSGDNCGDIIVINVDFNAWEYSGCDYLWAGIVTTLGQAVEDYFGKWKVRLCRVLLHRLKDGKEDEQRDTKSTSNSFTCCKMRIKIYVFLLTCISLLITATTVIAVLASRQELLKDVRVIMGISITGAVASTGALVTAFGVVLSKITKSTESVVKSITDEMRGENFTEELGFMYKIKQEVLHITDIVNYMSRLYGREFRILIVIDDLDRCQPNRIMGVLSAVGLLLEPRAKTKSPFISILAIDPRVVLGAIERHFDPDDRKDYTLANVNGYEYLKKIIHLPFCLPEPVTEEKIAFMKILHGEEKEPQDVTAQDPLLGTPSKNQPVPNTSTQTVSRQNPPGTPSSTRSQTRATGNTASINQSNPTGQSQSNRTSPTHAGQPSNSEGTQETADLMKFVNAQLCNRQLLKLMQGNPRSLKRIYNVMLLALSVSRDDMMTNNQAFQLLLIVIMVEQWPFRTSFLRQYYTNRVKKKLVTANTQLTEHGGIKVATVEAQSGAGAASNLGKEELYGVWEREKHSIFKVNRWQKFVSYDWDPQVFQTFIGTFRLTFEHLHKYIDYAVNHDTNIESVIELGLAEPSEGGASNEDADEA